MRGGRLIDHVDEFAAVVLAVVAFGFVRDAMSALELSALALIAISVVLALAQTAPLVLSGRRPLAAWSVLAVVLLPCWAIERAADLVPGRLTGVAMVVGLVVLYRLGLTATRLVAGCVGVITAVGMVLLRLNASYTWWPIVFSVCASIVLGAVVAARRRAETDLVVHREAGAVLTERARIARELHDVVAHHMSVVAVQAESASSRIDGLPPTAVAEFESIADGARACLDEMRQLLGTLRDEADGVARAPQPRLPELDNLVDALRRAGSSVRLDVDDSVDDLPEVCSVNAYRLVQEAWSNAVKHAPDAPVTTTITRRDDVLHIEVHNGLGRPGGSPADGTGQGLRGMRERAEIVGGTLTAGPDDGGGFLVRAALPIERRHR